MRRSAARIWASPSSIRSRSPTSWSATGSTAPTTALLHDTVEDTGVTLAELEKPLRGKEIARLVDDELTRLELQSERTKQAENFLVWATSEDIRVLIVKLADRLHNMRTIGAKAAPRSAPAVPPRARDAGDLRPARRAHRHGCAQDRDRGAFCQKTPHACSNYCRAPDLSAARADLIEEIEQDLRRVLAESGVEKVEILGREKSPYSIWLKIRSAAWRSSSCRTSWPSASSSRTSTHDRCLGGIISAYRAAPVQGLDQHAQDQRLPVAAHRRDGAERRNAKIEAQPRTRGRCMRSPSSASPRTGFTSRGRPVRRAKRYPWVRDLLDIFFERLAPAGLPRSHQARTPSRPGVLLHAEADRCHVARRRWTSPTRCIPRSATAEVGAKVRQDRAAAPPAREWRPGRDHHRACGTQT